VLTSSASSQAFGFTQHTATPASPTVAAFPFTMANVIDIADSIRYVVARAAQETTSALVTTPTPSSTIPPPQSTTSPAPSTSSSASGGGGGGGSSSPLLFFVALGFGVVFTNLW
jgi:hypothetical protein